ncbi:MAG: phosphoenolpyruvate carboxylase [Verrucomicrobiales bacterium]|jgi:phosphoenolpyruvate carboxylase|nr:phosphoenolpyruvate carboxylase [Verrucomicrobiales bacterium]
MDYVKEGFAKIDRDLDFLIVCFREVLEELGEKKIAEQLPFSHELKKLPLPRRFSPHLAQAYSIAFQLLNMVEENAAAQMRRARASIEDPDPEHGLWRDYLTKLLELGCKEKEIAETLSHIHVEPVLTAHPTEAKRATVLEKHRELYLLLVQRENQMWTPNELSANREQIKTVLERLWRTGEVLLEKPSVNKERQTILHYLREVFPAVLPRLDLRFQQAWEKMGFDPDSIFDPANRPRLTFGTWVGGDRDGHPLVTAETTCETLNELRVEALLVLHRMLANLPRIMSLSDSLQTPPKELLQRNKEIIELLGDRANQAVELNQSEPWRMLSALIVTRLPIQLNEALSVKPSQFPGCYRYSSELEDDLLVLRDSLLKVNAKRLAEHDVNPILRAVQVFGFHLASLDVRQNSAFHDKAMEQLLLASGLNGMDFANWPEKARLELLLRELRSPRPFLHVNAPVGPQADAVLSCYRVLARHIENYGTGGIGSLIISMTKRYSDLLVVYLLAREAGLTRYGKDGLYCLLPVVPLFETLEDLEGSPKIMQAFLAHPVTQLSLRNYRKTCQNTGCKSRRPVQQIMIGYSDSNKDAGILASQWGLHKTQKILVRIGDHADVDIRFFHGRGGTISRGAGPTHRFLEALPHGSLTGDLRVTEQGETIAQKYANLITATYNLELLLAGTTGITLKQRHSGDTFLPLAPVAERLTELSSNCYRQFLQTEGFMKFYEQATPIDLLENSRIGSRPSRRTGVRSLEDLRAIPWVFSWTQARFYLPGWYGVGTALETLKEEYPQDFKALREAISCWPFMRYVMTNIETNMASADLKLMQSYSSLVGDSELRNRFFGLISGEFKRTQRMLDLLFGGKEMKVRRPRMMSTLKLREEALRSLHMQQIDLLKRWRRLKDKGSHCKADVLLQDLLLSVNAIASALRTTG